MKRNSRFSPIRRFVDVLSGNVERAAADFVEVVRSVQNAKERLKTVEGKLSQQEKELQAFRDEFRNAIGATRTLFNSMSQRIADLEGKNAEAVEVDFSDEINGLKMDLAEFGQVLSGVGAVVVDPATVAAGGDGTGGEIGSIRRGGVNDGINVVPNDQTGEGAPLGEPGSTTVPATEDVSIVGDETDPIGSTGGVASDPGTVGEVPADSVPASIETETVSSETTSSESTRVDDETETPAV